jgi:hypothetical protein
MHRLYTWGYSPIFDLGLRFPARIFQTLTFFVLNSPLMPSVHFQCLTTYKSATIHNKVNSAILFLRNLVVFPTIPVSFFYDQKQKSSIGRLWRTIDKWRSKRNQAWGGYWGSYFNRIRMKLSMLNGLNVRHFMSEFQLFVPSSGWKVNEQITFLSSDFQPSRASLFSILEHCNQHSSKEHWILFWRCASCLFNIENIFYMATSYFWTFVSL